MSRGALLRVLARGVLFNGALFVGATVGAVLLALLARDYGEGLGRRLAMLRHVRREAPETESVAGLALVPEVADGP